MATYSRSIKNINSILKKYNLDFLESGVKWIVISGETRESRYVLKSDTVYIHPKDIHWLWTFGTTTYAIMLHELAHRFFEKFLTKNRLKQNDIIDLFGYYHKKYIRNFRYATTKKDLSDYASRYSLVHSADSLAEIFSVILQYVIKDKNPELFVKEHNKSEKCLQKIKLVEKLIKEIQKSNTERQ
jgi:hypothetical protein